MKNGRLLLVRHAQGSLGTDDYDRLSPLGHRQAEAIRAGLAEACWAVRGGLKRHRETAEYLPVAGGPFRTDPDLDEYRVDYLLESAFSVADSLGLVPPPASAWSDPRAYLETFLTLFPEVLAAWQAERLHCARNGTWSAFRNRVEAASARLSDAVVEHGTAVAVTSAGVISTMAAGLLGRDLAWQRRLNVSLYNASVTELARDRTGNWRAMRINCVEHLPERAMRTLA